MGWGVQGEVVVVVTDEWRTWSMENNGVALSCSTLCSVQSTASNGVKVVVARVTSSPDTVACLGQEASTRMPAGQVSVAQLICWIAVVPAAGMNAGNPINAVAARDKQTAVRQEAG